MQKQPTRISTRTKAIAIDKKAMLAQYRLMLGVLLASGVALTLYQLFVHLVH